ncbi:DUF58 domain-containing protein [Mesobacillus maritimus]|uniref:DUF58 domain-containing protein n=1 Tax=Mesobacillus maritimus TaxID=1643336 RepID=A0ABS7KBA7_9BACI|nr:DUF58 domain-containing protein [Mesobacillus maritimus]MBY0099518.1 DUF58 domain-containing protein [Mesobacillus maritimus]
MRQFSQKVKEVWKLTLLVLLIALTFSYAMFEGGFGSWFLFYSFLPFALYSFFLAFYPLADFSGKREFDHKIFNFGEEVTVNLTLKRKFPFPLLYIIVEEQVNGVISLNGDQTQRKQLIFPWFRKELHLQYTLDKLNRGEHTFKGIRIKTGDLFGIIEKERFIMIEDKMVVYPAYEEMMYRLKNSQFDQGTAATNEQVHRDTTMSVGVREYQPGDRFSWINWKATAKRNDFMTKEFEQRKSQAVLLAMDCAPDPHFEGIVTFAASMIRSILKKGAQIGLLACGDERFRSPIKGGESHQQQLFYQLAKIQCKCPTPFDQIIASEDLGGSQTSTIMLVTGKLTDQLIERLAFYSSRSGNSVIFLIKGKHDVFSKEERHLASIARAKGIQVNLMHEGHFAENLSEVSGG